MRGGPPPRVGRHRPAEPQPGPQGGPPTHLIVGRVLAPWGHRGQVRVEILTDFPQRFFALREIWVGVGEERRPYAVESARLHKGNVTLKLAGIDNPAQAEALRGELLYVPVAEAVPLGEDEYYHSQILGLDVWTTEGQYLGRVTEILETGSNDVYVVQGEDREILIPALATVVQQVDLERRRLIVALPPGLLEEEEA